MAVNRQANLLGQQRIDVPHLRAIESAACYDFDAIGLLVTGGVPCVVSGFEIVNASTVVGANASSIVLRTASARLVHPLASDSGSFFQVPADRADETLNTNNIRILGGWTPNAVNYVGVDLLRSADNTTSDTVSFLDSSADSETGEQVPLARTMDYVITISTSPFSASPTICPVAKVTLTASSAVSSIVDARNLLFRLGSGGDAPKSNNPFGWPGGRNEGSAPTALIAGDRSIRSMKQWCDAVMTRFQELGGGEYWYSLTSDRNVRLAQGSSPFNSTGEAFEWVSSNLHWQGLKLIFDNSTGYINEIKDQSTDSPGLTDLADGECIYVDLDRAANKTSSNALTAKKAVLATLGGSTVPGQRWVIAYRIGSYIYVKDQSFPVGSAWKLATPLAAGVIKSTISANGDDLGNAIAVGLGDSAAAYYTGTCGGISHNLDVGSGHLVPAGDIVIGRGTAAGDRSIYVQTNVEGQQTVIYGNNDWGVGNKAAARIIQGDSSLTGRIVDFSANLENGTVALPSAGTDPSVNVVSINSDGSIAMIDAATNPTTPVNGPNGDRAKTKIFFRKEKVILNPVEALFGLQMSPSSILYGWTQGPAGTWTKDDTTALGTTWTGGVSVTVGSRVLLCWPLDNPTYDHTYEKYYRIYSIVNMGGGSSHAVIKATDDPIFEGVTIKNEASSGDFSSIYFRLYTSGPLTLGTTPLIWAPTSPDNREVFCVMGRDGGITPILKCGPHYTTA